MLRAWVRTLRGRLLGVLTAGLAFLLTALAVNLYQLRYIGRSLELVNQVYLPLSSLCARMGGLLEPDPEHRESLARSIAETHAIVDEAPPTPDAEEAAALSATRRQVGELSRAYLAWQQADGPHLQEAHDTLRNQVLQLNALADGRIGTVNEKTGRIQVYALRQGLALIGIAVLMSGAVIIVTGRALGPVSRLTEQARQLALGEAIAPLPLLGDDEIATLARTFGQMAKDVEDRDRNLQALTLYLRRVLDSIGAAVVVAEGDRVRTANPPARALWGAREGEPVPASLGVLAEGRYEAREVGERFQDVVVRPFGEQGRIIVGEDSTERVQNRERLLRSERLALVGQMLAQVTHEVRNPLNALSLNVELLGDEVHTDEGRALLSVLQSEVGRLELLTERYLDLARRRPPDLAPEDPVQLAQSVLSLEEEALRRQGISARVIGEGGRMVDVDGNVLRRTLLNLIRNAAEAEATQIEIELALDERCLTILVRDDGPGMPPAVAARIFDPFYTTRARGTGLGLAISRQSIEDLGGVMRCETAPGEGTTFRVEVPVSPPVPAA